MVKNLKLLNIIEATNKDYVIKITYSSEKSSIRLERKDGSVIGEIDTKSGYFENDIREKLLTEWRRRFLARLSNNSLAVDIRIAKMNVKTDTVNSINILEIIGDPVYLENDPNNSLELYEGNWITPEVRNSPKYSVYVNILDLDSEGNISPIFPSPDRGLYMKI